MNTKQAFEQLQKTLKTIMPYRNEDTGETHFGLIHSLKDKECSFSIIAIRCDDEISVGRKNLLVGHLYQILHGYKIEDDKVSVETWRESMNLLYDDYSDDNINGTPHVQFSAIVGKNGSGKSSIIELMMRIINNFAVTIFGEVNKEPAADRIYYIDNVMGSMWFSMNRCIYKLSVFRNHVKLIQYTESHRDPHRIVYSRNKDIIDLGSESPDGNGRLVHMYGNEKEVKEVLNHFFYTLVSNYSIYAYNTGDFSFENITDTKYQEIFGKEPERINAIENQSWLHGLFHKNDGYKVPIGITPFRREGNIDINNEKDLAQERLISLMIRNHAYRTINNHIVADGLVFNTLLLNKINNFNLVKSSFFKNITPTAYEKMYNLIIDSWQNVLGVKFPEKPYSRNALDYIVYKTLKVSKQYGEHNEFVQLNELSEDFNPDAIVEMVRNESDDHSHITRKIFQTVAYLLFDTYDLAKNVNNGFATVTFEDILKKWNGKAYKELLGDLTRNKSHIINSAIFPPPFCTNRILMHPRDSSESIYFDTLSSGERQQIYSISSILYHLENLHSIKDDEYNKDRVFYPNVNLVLEEIELYFHPEMQRQFVQKLIDGIHAINLEHLNAVNFILVTHSPYVLSDIPHTNILALSEDGNSVGNEKLKAFGANVHEMLRSSFFLTEGSIGAFAQWEVKHIMACLNIHKWALTGSVDSSQYRVGREDEVYEFMERYTAVGKQDRKKHFEYEYFKQDLGSKQLKQRIDLIDEPVLRNILTDQYNRTFGIAVSSKEEKRKELLRQLKELEENDTI